MLDMLDLSKVKFNCPRKLIPFFSIRVFFHGHWRLTGRKGKRGDHLLFHSITSTCSRAFIHLFATLHVRWLLHIFNRTACIYQTATRWGLPPYPITTWLIDDVMLFFVCLLDDLILDFCYSDLTRKTGGLELTSIITLVLQANWLSVVVKCWRIFLRTLVFMNSILFHFVGTYFSTFHISKGKAVILRISCFWEIFLWSNNSRGKQNQLSNTENV